jgi:hypothetical protein
MTDAADDTTIFDTITASSTSWDVASPSTSVFDFAYADGRGDLLRLYDKGTRRQWVGSDRLDWDQEVNPDRPIGMPDEAHPLCGSPWWDKFDRKQKDNAHREFEAWRLSQFMHGEQGALISVAKIVQTVPNIDSKFYAATQTIDEARHVEVYGRYLHEKIGLVYPINGNLASLLQDTISDSRWDMTYLGMQVLIEGLALASFGLIRNMADEPLAKAINAYVMQDEARHVMFGRLALRDYYPSLTQAERDEREEFCVDACYRMRDRFMAEEVWERLDLPRETTKWVEESELFKTFRVYLFTRIVPVIRDIGLWGPKIRKAFDDMGVMVFAESDIEQEMAGDEAAAEEFDRAHLEHVKAAAAAVVDGGAASG